MARKVAGLFFLVVLGVGAGLAGGTEPTDALKIRLVRPDRQLERLIALFEGARAPDPAAALAAWKRANPDLKGLGKTLEAATAALNPGMIRELRNFNDAKIGLGLDPNGGTLRWYVVTPRDDGALAALTTAMTLTDGGPDAPYLDLKVDRLGRPGSPLALRVPGLVALAGSRADLPAALAVARARPVEPAAEASGWVVEFDPDALPVAGPISNRRLIEAIRALGLQRLEGKIGIEGETVEIAMTGEFSATLAGSVIEPAWLDWVPSAGIAAAGAIALDPNPQAWDAFFAWADRVERADPANGQLAPLRTRLTLLSIAVGIQPEVDLFPQVRGLTAFATPALPGRQGEVETITVALHVADARAAERLATHLVPRLVSSILKRAIAPAPAEGVQRLGTVSGRTLEVTHSGSTVLIGWGEDALKAALAAKHDPDHAVATSLRSSWGSASPPHRLGVVWPGRLGSPLLADAPPVVWLGRNETKAKGTRDVVRWSELRGVVRRLLERVPLKPSSTPRPEADRPSS